MDQATPVPPRWTAQWIWDEGTPRDLPPHHEIRCFRRTFDAPPGAKLTVLVSADSRYKLTLNGVPISLGPCKGDDWRKYYETVDLTPHLKSGRNVLAARVVHYHPAEPPQMDRVGINAVMRSAVGGFLLQGGINGGETLDTDAKWKVARDESTSFHSNAGAQHIGETEAVDGAKFPHGWETLVYDDSAWAAAVPFWGAMSPAHVLNMEFFGPWSLEPRPLPPMMAVDHVPAHVSQATQTNGFTGAAGELSQALAGKAAPAQLPPFTDWSVDIDAGELTTAYVHLNVQGGAGSTVRLTYAEAYGKGEEGNAWVVKGIRDDPASGGIYGQWDEYRPAGGKERYTPFWFRTFRFIRLKIHVGDQPLTVGALEYTETGYPLDVRSAIEASEPRFPQLWDISVRTLKRCMQETFVDCPYYEQLQYTMDTRLEALYGICLSADDRMLRKAIRDFHDGWHPSGLLQSRFPCVYPQIIPGFALHWILMIHDHWRFFGDASLVRLNRSIVDSVLDWFDRQLTPEGLVGKFYYWPYFDWVEGWSSGCPPPSPDKPATVFSELYAVALNTAAELAGPAGYAHREREYRERADAVNDAVNRHCWDAARGLYKDGPDTPSFSQHAQAWGILSGAAPKGKSAALATACLDDQSLSQMNWAMQFYLFRALKEAGLYHRSYELYRHWYRLADMHVTTWPEDPVHMRSDCHAWGSVPIHEFVTEVLGVQPEEAGFGKIRVAPQPGPLQWARGTVDTVKGPVRVAWERRDGKFQIDAKGPDGVSLKVVDPTD